VVSYKIPHFCQSGVVDYTKPKFFCYDSLYFDWLSEAYISVAQVWLALKGLPFFQRSWMKTSELGKVVKNVFGKYIYFR
jgi:hypothetical protein